MHHVLVWSVLLPVDKILGSLNNEAQERNASVTFHQIGSLRDLQETLKNTHAQILLADTRALTTDVWQFILSNDCIKWIHFPFAGVERPMQALHKLQDINKERLTDIKLTNRHGYGPEMLEYILTYVLYFERNVTSILEQQQRKEYNQLGSKSRLLSSCTIGLLGYGDIGRYVANVLKSSFGARIHAFRRSDAKDDHVDQLFNSTVEGQLQSFLSSGLDYVIGVLPSTQETRGMLNGDILQHCAVSKPIFMNLGRGDVIHENEIIKALDQGWIKHAVLDVYEVEPLPTTSPLWERKDVIATPHCSCNTTDFFSATATIFFNNFQKYVNNEALENVVSWDKGY
jgi:phosphoglycerate dehydrogenase-like enzyme